MLKRYRESFRALCLIVEGLEIEKKKRMRDNPSCSPPWKVIEPQPSLTRKSPSPHSRQDYEALEGAQLLRLGGGVESADGHRLPDVDEP